MNNLIIDAAADDIFLTLMNNKNIYICGNGGSYSIANHALCDLVKCVYQDSKIKINLHSLSNNIELISAISNDISYEDIFSYQYNIQSKKGDIIKKLKRRVNFNFNLYNQFKKIQLPLSYKKKKSNYIIKNNFTNKLVKISVKKILKEII